MLDFFADNRIRRVNFLRSLFSKVKSGSSASGIAPLPDQPRSEAKQASENRPDLRFELLSIRLENLMVLMNRWPSNDEDLKDWDRVAELCKRDQTNPMSAAVALKVEFTQTFWQVLLSNAIWNFDSYGATYLDQQAALFHMKGDNEPFRREAELICEILIVFKELEKWNPAIPFELDDCREFLKLAEILPATEDKHIVSLLGLVVNHTLAFDSFRLEDADFQFWSNLARLLERSARGVGDPRNIAAAARVRGILQQRWNFKDHVFQLSSNKSATSKRHS